jgi:hypothetical protein
MQTQKQGSPTGKKIIPIELKKTIILSDLIRQATESYSIIHTKQYIYEENTGTF